MKHRDRVRRAVWALVVALGLLEFCPAARAAAPFPVEKIADVMYYHGPGSDPVLNQLDLFVPKGKKDFPVIMFVHGGMWMLGDKSFFGHGNDIGNYFAGQGVGVVMPSYRLWPAVKPAEQAQGVAWAVAWTVKHIAEHAGSPDRLFLCGHSAGGQLVSLLATDPSYLKSAGVAGSAIKGVISVSGVYRAPQLNLTVALSGQAQAPAGPLATLSQLVGVDLGGAAMGTEHVVAGVSAQFHVRLDLFEAVFTDGTHGCRNGAPLAHVHAGLPPFLIVYASQDLPTLPEMAREFAARLKEAGCDAHLLQVEHRDHEAVMFEARTSADPVAQAILRFVASHR